MQYAPLARRRIRSAISTYEQLLFYNPNLASVRFELGVLYYRLGSYEMARGYFDSALKMKDITPALRQRAEDLITAIDKKLQPDQFSGYVQSGFRYQTNAALGPAAGTTLASCRVFNNSFAARPDWNWFGAFGLNYVHDFEQQNGNTFEASALGYDAQQFKLHQFDIGVMELRAGPRFGIVSDTATGLSIKPYFIATGDAGRRGLLRRPRRRPRPRASSSATLRSTLTAEIVRRLCATRRSIRWPAARAARCRPIGLQASGPVYASLGFQSRVTYAHANANFNPFGYNAYAGDIWLPWNFSPLNDGRTWTLTPTAGVSWWQYNAPDPTIDPNTTPNILEWRVGLGLEVPIWKLLNLGFLAQYRADVSNVPAFSMHDFSVTAGPTMRF